MAVLEVLNGAGAGSRHRLVGPRTVLGRHSSCDIVVPAGKISRRHAQIVQEGGGYYLEDLQSRNGTFLNGQEVGQRVRLRDEDLIELADSQFRFLLDESDGRAGPDEPQETAQPARDRPLPKAPQIVRSLDAYEERVQQNSAAKLRAVLEISRHLGSSLDLDVVLPKVLDSVFTIFPQADRGYILLAVGPKPRLEPRALKLRRDDSGFALTIRPISRTITEKVFHEGQAVLSSDVQADERFQQSASALDFEIRSMICAPLIGPSRRPQGIIYVDTQDPEQQFDENDLDVLLSVAALAAQAVEYARVHEALIAERRQAEETLRASEQRFRAVWDTSADAMRLTDESGTIIAVNQAYCQLAGMLAADLEGQPFTAVYASAEETATMLREYQEQFAARSRYRQRERQITFRSGKQLDVSIRNSFIEVEPGQFILLSIFRDLTDRKRTEAALQESENRFGILFQEALLGIAVGDLEGHVVQVNPTLRRILGTDEAALAGRHLAEITHPDNVAAGQRIVRQLLDGARSEYRTERRLSRDGDGRIWGDVAVSVVRDTTGQPLHLILMVEDISERKRLEKEVADLAVAEQQRIGQELHDELGQVLTGLGYLCRSLINRLQSQQSPEVPSAEQLADGLRKALTQVRTIAKGLVPVEIDAEGLQVALREMAARVEEIYGIRCRFETPQPIRVEDSNIAVHLYHIAQEAVTNALKHGQAQSITVQLEAPDSEIRLTVQDDGVGLSTENGPPSGIGLRIMRYRAGIIGAAFDLHSAPGEGTTVTCILRNEG